MNKLIGHVLIVENEPRRQKQTKEHLTALGLTSDISNNRQQALITLRNNRGAYDLIFINLNKKNLDSYRLAKETKNNIGQYGYSNIIGYTEETHNTLGNLTYFDEIISKKLTTESIYNGISKFLVQSDPLFTTELSSKLEHEFTHYDSDKKIEIYNIISSSLSDDMNNLKNNAGDLKALAHKIKGTASILGLNEVSSLAQELQTQLCPLKEANSTKLLIQQIQTSIKEVEC
ncbi:hypothetical protein HGG78_18770, partial [Vibrio aestuarianus]|uniref:Hpt domain-containing protein n=1 Tax=Vibrio aestuarianus TaxID=28171 RepID=UPI0015591FF8